MEVLSGRPYVQANMEFHARLADAGGNPIFVIILEPIHELLRESRRQTIGHYGLLYISEPHRKILDAVRAQDPDGASRAMRQHIEIATAQIAQLRHTVEGSLLRDRDTAASPSFEHP